MQKLLFIHALSPLHVGTGQSVGAIDLPIARDKTTGFPYLPGSSLKGSLREQAINCLKNPSDPLKNQLNPQDDPTIKSVFGPTANNSEATLARGSLIVGDANLVCLPVRSIAGTFAYATSPWLLMRLNRDLLDIDKKNVLNVPPFLKVEKCIVCHDSILTINEKVVFEDLDLSADKDSIDSLADYLAKLIFGQDKTQIDLFKKRFCIVSDDVMSFLSQHATDIVTRVSIDQDSGTAKDGALWTEENLPVETILAALLFSRTPIEPVNYLESLCQASMQLGGKATVGRGRCKLYFGNF